jgi:hypothetical protein
MSSVHASWKIAGVSVFYPIHLLHPITHHFYSFSPGQNMPHQKGYQFIACAAYK